MIRGALTPSDGCMRPPLCVHVASSFSPGGGIACKAMLSHLLPHNLQDALCNNGFRKIRT